MDSSYLKHYSQSADANTMFDGAALTDLQKELLAKVDEYGVVWAERAFKQLFPFLYNNRHEQAGIGNGKAIALLVTRTQISEGAAEALARGLIDYGQGGELDDEALAAALQVVPTPAPTAGPTATSSATPTASPSTPGEPAP